MAEPDWNQRAAAIRRAIGELGKLAPDDPVRHRGVKELSRRMRMLLDDEDVPGQPEWVARHRELARRNREFGREVRPLLDAVKAAVDERTGRRWGDNLHVGCDLELTHMRFDAWYETDAELEDDRSSGRRVELVEAMQAVAREIANAASDVYFHSHQFVREKCGGDYFSYLR